MTGRVLPQDAGLEPLSGRLGGGGEVRRREPCGHGHPSDFDERNEVIISLTQNEFAAAHASPMSEKAAYVTLAAISRDWPIGS